MASFFDLLTTKQAFLDAQGNPLNGGRLWTKVSGSNTNKTTFKDADGSVPNTNPIILDPRGEVPFGVFGSTGPYRLILTTSGDLTDPPTSPIWGPRDNVAGINDFVPASTEWSPTGLTPTFISATSFSVAGDQTLIFEARRRVRATVGAGQRYATIQSAVFTTLTTVTLVLDGSGLDGSLSAVAVGIITATNTSQPHDSALGLNIASAGTLTLPANADRFLLTGTATISAIAGSWLGRHVYLAHAGAQLLTNGASFQLPGGQNLQTGAQDETEWVQTNLPSTWKMIGYTPFTSALRVGVLDRETSTITIVNSITETTIASVLVPGGTMGSDGMLEWRVFGNILNNSGAARLVEFRIRLGGVTAWFSGGNLPASTIRSAFYIHFIIANKGSASIQSGGGNIVVGSSVASPTTGLGEFSSGNREDACIATSNTDLTVATGSDQTFEISARLAVANASFELVRKYAICTLS